MELDIHTCPLHISVGLRQRLFIRRSQRAAQPAGQRFANSPQRLGRIIAGSNRKERETHDLVTVTATGLGHRSLAFRSLDYSSRLYMLLYMCVRCWLLLLADKFDDYSE